MTRQSTIEIHIHYPLDRGQMVLRTSLDWDLDVPPAHRSEDGQQTEFRLTTDQPYIYFKPVWLVDDGVRWSAGNNYLVVSEVREPVHFYPYFDTSDECSVNDVCEIHSPELAETCRYRIFYPPGYRENTLKRYPVLYMHDGQNLFFPDEAFGGQTWKVQETLLTLTDMCNVDKVIVVGIYPNDRERDYTFPGYEPFGRFIVEDLKPAIDTSARTLPGPGHTAVMGSSLGGVAAFYLGWRWPEVFGKAACMSSTFGWRDDLLTRVRQEPKVDTYFYLDSGWPSDNYEVTRNLGALMLYRGFEEGRDLTYFAFPEALHNEQSWAMRAHIPFQLFFGRRPLLLPRPKRTK